MRAWVPVARIMGAAHGLIFIFVVQQTHSFRHNAPGSVPISLTVPAVASGRSVVSRMICKHLMTALLPEYRRNRSGLEPGVIHQPDKRY